MLKKSKKSKKSKCQKNVEMHMRNSGQVLDPSRQTHNSLCDQRWCKRWRGGKVGNPKRKVSQAETLVDLEMLYIYIFIYPGVTVLLYTTISSAGDSCQHWLIEGYIYIYISLNEGY